MIRQIALVTLVAFGNTQTNINNQSRINEPIFCMIV